MSAVAGARRAASAGTQGAVRPGRAAWRGGQVAVDRGRSTTALITTLQRLVPLAQRLVRGVRLLWVSAAVSAVLIVAAPLVFGWPSLTLAAVMVVLAMVLGLVPLVLWLFADALAEVLALPGWLRASPDIVRSHGRELSELVVEARSAGRAGPRRRTHVVRDGWRAGRLLLLAHAEVPGYGAALRLVSPLFLLAVAAATMGALVEITLAPFVVTGAVALRLL